MIPVTAVFTWTPRSSSAELAVATMPLTAVPKPVMFLAASPLAASFRALTAAAVFDTAVAAPARPVASDTRLASPLPTPVSAPPMSLSAAHFASLLMSLMPLATAPREAARSMTLVSLASLMAASATVAKPSPALVAALPMLSNTPASFSSMPAMLSLMLTTPSLMLVITPLMASPIAVIGVASEALKPEKASTISARFLPTLSTIPTTVSPMVLIRSATELMIGVTCSSRPEKAEMMSGRLSVTAATMSVIASVCGASASTILAMFLPTLSNRPVKARMMSGNLPVTVVTISVIAGI